LLGIFKLLNNSIKNSGYLGTLYKFRVLVSVTFLYPNVIIKASKAIFKFKASKTTIIRNLWRAINKAYANNLKLSERVNALIWHSDFIASEFKGRFLVDSHDEIKLWSSYNLDSLEVYLSTTEPHSNHEGILSLTLRFKGQPIFYFSFLFCSNRMGNNSETILFLTRIQGVPGNYADIKLINKLMGNLNLSNILLSALEGLAMSLNIRKIRCVSATNQCSFNSGGSRGNFHSTYDEFLVKNGAIFEEEGFFSLPIPLPIKDLTMVQAHRSRHKKHSAKRREISDAVRTTIQSEIQKRVNFYL